MFKFLVRFLKILVILSVIGVSFKIIDMVIHKDNYKEKEQANIEQIAMDNVLDRLSEENFIRNDGTEIIEQEADNSNQEETKKEVQLENKKVEVKEQIKQITETKNEEKATQVSTNEEKVEEQKIEIETKIIEEKQESLTEDKKTDEQNIVKDEYKENSQMINKIKYIINNNLSDDMKEYGYNIVVDSSIPELTNEFTFTEQRVINKLKYKSGTIRIYARDYYYYGKYVSTQCFII